MKRNIKQLGALTATSLSVLSFMFAGSAFADASTGVTGNGSTNQNVSQVVSDYMNRNNNDVWANNTNHQTAYSGSSSSNGNTIAGGHGYDLASYFGGMGGNNSYNQAGSYNKDNDHQHNNSDNDHHDDHSQGNNKGGGGSTGSASNTNWTNTNVSVSNDNGKGGSCKTSSSSGSGGTIGITGPDSTNIIRTTLMNSVSNMNRNNLMFYNLSNQGALSGDSSNDGNTIGGGAGRTGNASNTNGTNTNVWVNNDNGNGGSCASSSGMVQTGSIWISGPRSTNLIVNYTTNTYSNSNTNTVAVYNSNTQGARSGDTSSSYNTIAGGGSGSTGNASNTAAANTNVNISNNTSSQSTWNSSNNDHKSYGGMGGSGGSVIGITGPGSRNEIVNYTTNTVTNTNDNQVMVANANNQTALTGDSSNDGNTIGGGAGHTGNAANTDFTNSNVALKND